MLKRLDVVAALRHPWVTRGGSLPLHSLAAAAAGTGASSSRRNSGTGAACSVQVSEQDMQEAIRQIDGSLAAVMDWVFEEARYADG